MNTLVPATQNYSELSANNLFIAPALPALPFSLDNCINYGANVFAENKISDVTKTYKVTGLGGVDGGINAGTLQIDSIPTSVTGTVTLQFLLSLLINPTNIPKFRVIAEIKSGVTVIDSSNVQYDSSDYLTDNIVSATLTGTGVLTFKILFEDLMVGETLTAFLTVPQIANLPFVTTFANMSRVKDVYAIDTTLDFDASTIEIGLQTDNTQDCVLFDAGNIKGSYTVGNVVFQIGASTIMTPLAINTVSTIAFDFNKQDGTMTISADDVVLLSSSVAFTLTSIGKMFIGCDSAGNNQFNGLLNTFKILRG